MPQIVEVVDPGEALRFKHKTSLEYDKRFGYRVMENLRNFAQHGGLPVQGLKLTRWRKGADCFRHQFELSFPKSVLVDSKWTNAKIRAELQAHTEDMLPLVPLVRSYVAGLAAVHEAYRSSVQSPVSDARMVVDRMRRRFTIEESSVGMCILVTINGVKVREHFLPEDLERTLDNLTARNAHLMNLEFRRVVS